MVLEFNREIMEENQHTPFRKMQHATIKCTASTKPRQISSLLGNGRFCGSACCKEGVPPQESAVTQVVESPKSPIPVTCVPANRRKAFPPSLIASKYRKPWDDDLGVGPEPIRGGGSTTSAEDSETERSVSSQSEALEARCDLPRTSTADSHLPLLSLRGGYDPPSRSAQHRLVDTPHGQGGAHVRPEPEPGDSPRGQSANRNLDGGIGYGDEDEGDADGPGNDGIDALLQVAEDAGADQSGSHPAEPVEAHANANNQGDVHFIGPAPAPASSDIQMFSISYHGEGQNNNKGVLFKIKSWGGMWVLVVHSVIEGGLFRDKLQENDVIMCINDRPVFGTIKKDVPASTQEALFVHTINSADRLRLLCQRNGTSSRFDLANVENVTDNTTSNPTPSPTSQMINDDYPIGLPVRVQFPFRSDSDDVQGPAREGDHLPLGYVEGVVTKTLRNGTVWVQPDDMTLAQYIVVEQHNQGCITNILRERMDARQAAHDNDEIGAQNGAVGRRNVPRSDRSRTDARIQAAANGLAPARFARPARRLKSDGNRMAPYEKPLAFHDAEYFTDNPLTRLVKMDESEFCIRSALSFAPGLLVESQMPSMMNEGDQVESDELFIDESYIQATEDEDQDVEGRQHRRYGQTKAIWYNQSYNFKHGPPSRGGVGICSRARCSGRIARVAPSVDDFFEEVSGIHKIQHSHSNECQVRWIVENRAALGLSNDQIESLLTWRINVDVGYIDHPIFVSTLKSETTLTRSCFLT